MSNILRFERPRPRGNTLCRHGHHKWKIEKDRVFDVKEGQLVTAYKCMRCGKRKTKSI